MAGSSLNRLTGLSYTIFLMAFVLFALSITEVILETKILHVFRELQIQVPGSSLAEWLFISLNPHNLDTGPTFAIFVCGGCGIAAGTMGMIWMLAEWFGLGKSKMRKLALTTLLVSVVGTAASMAVMTYVFIAESNMKLPAYITQWRRTQFTREYYICDAFPSQIPDAETSYYGFAACDVALAARWQLIGISCVSILLSGLSIVQAYKHGAFKRMMSRPHDIEKGVEVAEKPKPRGFGIYYQNHPVVSAPSSQHGHGSSNVSVTSFGNVRIARPPPSVQHVQYHRYSVTGFYKI